MEDFVPYELAVKLNEVGFNYDTKEVYEINVLLERYFEIPKPTISQVLKWMREEKKIHIVIDIWGRTWGYDVLSLPSGESQHWTAYEENIKSYEHAALAGIEYIIDNNLI